MRRKRRYISDNKAKKYYDILKTKVRKKGCTVSEVKKSEMEEEDLGFYIPDDFKIEIKINRSYYIMLIILAHELGHFTEYMTYFRHYGPRAYKRLINQRVFRKADLVLSEAMAWIMAEKELNRIDKEICLDYRFFKYRTEIFDNYIREQYERKKDGI